MLATYAAITDPNPAPLNKRSISYGMLLKVIIIHFGAPYNCLKPIQTSEINTTSIILMKLDASVHQRPSSRPPSSPAQPGAHNQPPILLQRLPACLSLPIPSLNPARLFLLISLFLLPLKTKVPLASLFEPLDLPTFTINSPNHRTLDQLSINAALNTDLPQHQGQ